MLTHTNIMSYRYLCITSPRRGITLPRAGISTVDASMTVQRTVNTKNWNISLGTKYKRRAITHNATKYH